MMHELATLTKTPPLTCLSEEEQLFADSVRKFAETEVGPYVSEMDASGKLRPEFVTKCFGMGLMGIEAEERYGGAGGSFFMCCLAIEEVARVDSSVCVLIDVQNTLVNNAFSRWGSDALKEKYLPRLTSELVGAYALSEAGSGSDAFALKTRAEETDDGYVLNGRKLWISNSMEAGLFTVFATVDPEQGYHGITAFAVERDFPGFSIGRAEDKLGLRASSTCELILDHCRVPKENLLGEVGKGYKIAIETLNDGRIGIGAQMVGLSRGAFELALAYTQERQQFGKPICEFEGVQFQLAEMAVDLETARLLVYNAARLKDAGMPFTKEAAMAKLHATNVGERIASMAVELHGGIGISKESPVEKFFRDAKVAKIYEGTSNMQRLTIAKQLLAGR